MTGGHLDDTGDAFQTGGVRHVLQQTIDDTQLVVVEAPAIDLAGRVARAGVLGPEGDAARGHAGAAGAGPGAGDAARAAVVAVGPGIGASARAIELRGVALTGPRAAVDGQHGPPADD